ncbi:T9SS type A sorting domain-containing protein [Adhaeribacter sp. BT258]|uniref:T9SS type A sorting domain-containing protein n=1 Tax=Adhaeribacter terrigena TaxID=2793070 RepID=A0ABS1C067_9BACT|nr:LamG-like jellyroll fold domain-containing protein [Adhaeribacter terrigena]MBK0401900.1 T9SS type A sorting domain-containing protein [Adhaeribacter terrigena]
MRKAVSLMIAALLCIQTAFAQFPNVSNLKSLSITTNTREKPQSKAWIHDGKHFTVLSDGAGAHVFRLDNTTWTRILTILNKDNRRADCKVNGNLVHILLFRPGETDLVSLEYVAASSTYKRWTSRTSTIRIPTNLSSETATIDLDTNNRMWMASDDDSSITIRWSDSPYSSWSSPITIASGIDPDDIGAVVAFPMLNKIGVFWSNQVTKRFGFRMHTDGTNPGTWTADEIPASQSALNKGNGMADDHMNLKVASDGTLYCAVKTSYDSQNYPRIALLVRRPSGTWDNLYGVSNIGTRGIVVLNEQSAKIRIVYASNEDDGDILYKESSTNAISFGSTYTLISGTYNNPTSIKNTFSPHVVILASTSSEAVGVLVTDDGTPPPQPPGVPTLNLPANGATGVSITPTLSWNAVTNATSYQVQLSASSSFSNKIIDSSNVTGSAVSVSGLAYNTPYYWRVRASNSAGFGNWSVIRNFTTEAEPIIVPDAATLQAPANTATNIDINPTLSWHAANNALTYRLQVATSNTFSTLVADSSNITSLSQQLTGLNHSTQYFWRVKTYSHNGEGNWSSTWNFTTVAAPTSPPTVPVLASPLNNATNISLATTVSWNATTDARSYQFQIATDSNFQAPVYDINNITALSVSVSGLEYNTQYYWRVRAVNAAGASNWSTVWNFTTVPQPVALVGHWQMEDPAGTTLSDASGNGNHATTSGNPGFVTGRIGQALHLTGLNQYATAPHSTTLNPGSGITLTAWIKPETSGSRQFILKKGLANDGYEISLTGSARVAFRFNQISALNNYQVVSNATAPTNGQTWLHVAATYDGSVMKIYLNGTLDDSQVLTSTPVINSNNEPLSFGATSSGNSRFQGYLDDARIYNIALTASEINALATVSVARMSATMQTPATLEASPNPFRLTTKIKFTVPDKGDYAVILYNMEGNPVKVLKKGNAQAGDQLTAEIKGQLLPRGLYVVRVQSSKTSQTLKLMME